MLRVYALGVLSLITMSGQAMAKDPATTTPAAQVLRAKFFYRDELSTGGMLTANCPQDDKEIPVALGGLLTDVAVGLAGKAAESLIDAAAARTQPEATTLDAVVPLDGFYDRTGAIAAAGGCLVFHNGTDEQASNATLKAVFQVKASSDGSAFRFTVVYWKFDGFLKGKSTQWFQSRGSRDIALKIEFLTPGNASLGTRAAFIEQVFAAVEAPALPSLFLPKQELPWFAAPPRPTSGNDGKQDGARVLPLNLRVTLVETTRPNQLGLWVRAMAQENRAAVSTLVQDSVRKALDPVFEATEGAKLAEAAGIAYSAYKTAWDELKTHLDTKPDAADVAATHAWTASFIVKRQGVTTKQVVARSAFDAAGLSWPGSLPDLSSS